MDQDGDVLDILVQPHRDQRAAERFFRKLLKGLHYAPRLIVADRLGSYGAARRKLLPSVGRGDAPRISLHLPLTT